MERPKLKDVFEELVDVSPKWKLIAIQLEVDDKKIQGDNPDERLLEVLREYLNGPQPSWEGIARALNTRSVKEMRLAGEINKKFCGSKGTTSESDVTVKPLEMGMSSLTIAEEEASEPRPEPQQSKEGNEAARPPSHVDATAEPMKPKPRRLVPIRMPSTSSESDPFTSPDSVNVESQCSLPYLKTPDLSEEARKNFIGRLLHETENMELSFSELMLNTRKSLESSKVPLKDLLAVLLPMKSATVQSTDTPCGSWKKKLTKAENIFEVFTVVEPFTSFFNHEIIEQIIKCFGNEDDRQRLADYKLAFTKFCNLSVCECPNGVYGTKTENDGVVTVKLNNDFDKYTVNAINKFRYKLCKILEVSEYNLRLMNVTDGCTQIKFAVFIDLLPQIFPLSAEKKIKLKEERVILLKWKTHAQKHHNIELKQRVDQKDMFIEALQHRSQSIMEHVDLVMGVYYLQQYIEYNTTEVPGKAGFKSTVVSPLRIESDVCLTEAEAEDNAALKLYMKLLPEFRFSKEPITNNKTYMKEQLEERLSTSQEDLHVYYRTNKLPDAHSFQSTVDVPGIGAIEGAPCRTEITAEESAACAAYLALRRHEALAKKSSKTN